MKSYRLDTWLDWTTCNKRDSLDLAPIRQAVFS